MPPHLPELILASPVLSPPVPRREVSQDALSEAEGEAMSLWPQALWLPAQAWPTALQSMQAISKDLQTARDSKEVIYS